MAIKSATILYPAVALAISCILAYMMTNVAFMDPKVAKAQRQKNDALKTCCMASTLIKLL